jgi:hypothetical protein
MGKDIPMVEIRFVSKATATVVRKAFVDKIKRRILGGSTWPIV